MSDHFDAEDSRTDLTDLYAFPSADRLDHTVLIFAFNPEAVHGEVAFDPAASYELKIDTDGDLEADVAFHVVFDLESGTAGRATVYLATGTDARGAGRIGGVVIQGAPVRADGTAEVIEQDGYRFLAGLRSDPHFKDVKGFRNNFAFTGDDPIARRNVFGVALEVPTAVLGADSLRIWARSVTVVDGEVRTVDQAGRPGINNALNGGDEDGLEFNATPPSEQRDRFGERFRRALASFGYPVAEAERLADELLPDVLEYRINEPASYPNGRRLTDDTADWLLSLLTMGRLTSDLVGPHTDLLATFPYLGPPHPPELALTHLE